MRVKLKDGIAQKDILKEKEYTVFFFTSEGEKLDIYLFDESPLGYFFPYSIDSFDITDNRPSRFWVIDKYKLNSGKEGYIISFPEMAKNFIKFYNSYIDGNVKERVAVEENWRRIFFEFPHKEVDKKAIILKENWLQCSICDAVWSNQLNLAMVQCPECNELLHNPSYLSL